MTIGKTVILYRQKGHWQSHILGIE